MCRRPSEGARPDRLKILIALLYYVPHRTGLTLHVQRVAEELARRGHEVTVLTARYRLDLPRDEAVINGVRVAEKRGGKSGDWVNTKKSN